jgi:acetylornithine deacetylase/succinyl-diaminopimelate desuccinylase-like protein
VTASPDCVELLQALVRIPSVNPTGEPGTSEVGEARCAGFLAQQLEDCGASAELREILPGRPNVLARFPADRPGKPRLLLCPHTDTVSVAGMTIDPFAAEQRGGRVYGRGACDTKGTISAMLCALWETRAELPRLRHEVWFAGLMGEEAGNEGAAALAEDFSGREDFAGADFALVGEPTRCDIVNTHKGVTWLRLTAHGRSAHSAAPERGENAIYKMADVLRVIRDEWIPELSTLADPVLGPPTASAGRIHGGSKINIVPETCSVELDLRTVPAQLKWDIVAEVRGRLRRACPDLEVSLIRAHVPLYTAPDHPCVQALARAGGRCVGAPWFCDGSLLAEKGIPAVAAGPGDIAQAHTADEWIDEDELRRGVEFYRRFLLAV